MKNILGIEESALYKKTETLLKEYSSMQARLKNLQIDLANMSTNEITETEEETILGLYYARHVQEGIPQGGGISDKTSSVALKWREEHENIVGDMSHWFKIDKESISYEIGTINRVLKKVDNAINSLSDDERVIIQNFYIENKPWYDIAYKVKYVERHCKRLRTRAIWYMSKSIFGGGVVR